MFCMILEERRFGFMLDYLKTVPCRRASVINNKADAVKIKDVSVFTKDDAIGRFSDHLRESFIMKLTQRSQFLCITTNIFEFYVEVSY